MGLVSAILMIIGTLIGTGIFASPGPLFDSVHCTQTSFIIWAFAGVVCTIGAFAYAELGTMFPASGGDFQYLRRAYGKKVAWVFGWSFITILNPIGTAGIAGVLGRYAVDLIVYSRTGGNSIAGAATSRAVSAMGAAAGASSMTQDAMINTLGRMMWTSVNGTAAVWAAGAGVGNPSGAGAGALDTGYAPFPNAPFPPNHAPTPSQQQHADAMPWLVRGFSIAAIILMGLINIFFREGGKYASNLLAIFKIGGMCMLIVIGSMQAIKNHAQSEALQIPIRESSQNVLDYVSALCFAFFAYNGFNNINLGLGELRNPEKNLKRAVFIAMPFVTILFLLANFAFFSILSSYDLRHVHSLSLHAGHTVLGQPGGFLMAGTVVASALGSINANLWAGSRLLVIMAKDNTIVPFPVARVWSRTRTQAIAILILVGQASFHSLINLDFKTFSKIYSAVGWTWYGVSVAGLLYLRKKRPNYPRPVKVFWPLAAFFVVVAAVLVIGSLTLAFMSSTIQKATTGANEDDEEDDVATGGGADGSGAGGGKYVSIIMFGMVILFMLGVIPAFYLTKRYNHEHGLKTAGNSGTPSIVESDAEASAEDQYDDHAGARFRQGGGGAGAGEMVQVNRTGPSHPYQHQHHLAAITIDIDLPTPTHATLSFPSNIHTNNDLTSLTVPTPTGGGGPFGDYFPESLIDGRPARRHSSAASSVTLVGKSSKKRKNKPHGHHHHRRHKSRDASKHSHRQSVRQGGEPSRSPSLDLMALGHRSEAGKDADEQEVGRVIGTGAATSGTENGMTRRLSLDHVDLGTIRNSPSSTSSNTASASDSDADTDTDSDTDNSDSASNSDDEDEHETDIDSTRPPRPANLLFFPFNPSSPSSSDICMSPTMLTPLGSASQTAFNSPMLDNSSPIFFADPSSATRAGGFLTCGSNTRSGSRSSEMTLGLEGDYHHLQQQMQEVDGELDGGDIKGKSTVRTRQPSTCERFDEEESDEQQENRTNNNNNSTTHYGSHLTDLNNNNQQGQNDAERVHPLTLSHNTQTGNTTQPAP
ncbi:hypothetical protein BGW39_009064 [Mortierella sp. 14UC]|nr:hypothetical protein BGW39_009064 [Mortierella sp. 14UC]